MFRFLFALFLVSILAACDREEERETETGAETKATPQEVRPPEVDLDEEEGLEGSPPEVEVREAKPAQLPIDPADDIAGDAIQTRPGPEGVPVDLIQADVEDDKLVVVLHYRNPSDQTVSVPVPRDSISYRAGEVTTNPLPDEIWPAGDMIELEPNDYGLLQISFAPPAPDAAEISLILGELEFENVPVTRVD